MWLANLAHLIHRTIRPVTRIVNSLAVCLLIVMMLDIVVDVGMRYLLNQPVLGTITYEAIGFMMVILAFLAIPYCQVQKAHISVELVTTRLPDSMQAIISTITYFICFGLVSVMTWRTVIWARHMRDVGVFSVAFDILIFPFYYVVAFGLALLSVVLLANFLESLAQVVRK